MVAVISITIICAVLLVLVVLSQSSKGGLSSQFGGSGASTQMIGVKRATDFLEKATWVLAGLVIVLSMTSSLLIDLRDNNTGFTSPNIENAQDRNVLPEVNQDIPPIDDEEVISDDVLPEGIDNDLDPDDAAGDLEGLEEATPADSDN